jgi:hypothetical protein
MTVGPITVTSGQPILFFYTDLVFDSFATLSDNFTVPYTWTTVQQEGDGAQVYIGTGGQGTSGTISISGLQFTGDTVSLMAVPCIGASTAPGLQAIDVSGKATSSTAGPSLTPVNPGEGAVYLAAGTTVVGGPSSPWVLTTQAEQSLATYAAPPFGAALAPTWTSGITDSVGLVIRAAQPAPVQTVVFTFSVTQATQTATMPVSVTPGNALILLSGIVPTTTISSISGGGVTWVKAIAFAGSGGETEIWYGFNSTGVGTSIAVTYAASVAATTNSAFTVQEWSGYGILRATASGNVTAASSSYTVPAVTCNQGDLIVICDDINVGGPTGNPVDGANTGQFYNSGTADVIGYVTAPAAGSQTVTMAGTTGNSGGFVVAAFGPANPKTYSYQAAARMRSANR